MRLIFLIALSYLLMIDVGEAHAQSPAAPTELYVYEGLGQGTENGFELRWQDNATDEDSYLLERSTDGINFVVKQALPANTKRAADGIEVGSLYWYRVRAKKGSIFSGSSNVLFFTSLWSPIYFTVDTTQPDRATLTFFDRSIKEQGYFIERSADNGKTFSTLVRQPTANFAIVPGAHGSSDKTKVYVDTNGGVGLTKGVRYQYRVAAYDAVGPSAFARPGYLSIAPGMVPNAPALVTQLTADSSNNLIPTTVRITLTDNSNNEKRTEVQRSLDRLTWTTVGGLSSTAGEFVINDNLGNPTPNTTYYYRAYATNDIGQSPYSAVTSVTIPGIPPQGRSSWYVWRGATGPATGESWQNAWRDISEINWVAIKPGHTLYISGDNYQGEFAIYASGTQELPISIRPGSAAPSPDGHSTPVTVRNIYFGPRTSWIRIDGARTDGVDPVNALESQSNINFFVRNAPKHGIFSSSPIGITLRFIEVENAAESGIVLVGLPSDYLNIYACHVKTTGLVGISFGYPSPRPVFDAFTLRKTLIEYTGDDAIQSSGNLTMSDNIIRYNNPDSAGHADGIQSVGGSYFKIYNNTFYDRTKSSYFFTSGSARSGVSGHWHVFNNVFYYSALSLLPATAVILFSGQNDYEPSGAFIPEVTFSDILIANNTFVNFGTNRVLTFTKRDTQVGKVRVTDLRFVNNLMLNTGGISLKGDAASGYSYDEANLLVDNNVFAGSGDIHFKGSFLSVPQFNQLLGVSGNNALMPNFVDPNAQNFRLLDADSAARDKGRDLSADFSFDIEGLPRPFGAQWDIGAYEQGSSRKAIPSTPSQLRISSP